MRAVAAPAAGGRRPAPRRIVALLVRVDPVLVAVAVAGAGLRFWGLGYGLPYVYNPDESSILLRALSLGAGSLDPRNFLYPSLYLYVLAGVTGALYVAQHLAGVWPSLAAFQASFLVDPTPVYLAARGLSAASGTATIVATYALASRVGGRTTARAASALLAFAYIPVRDAHMVKHDVPVTLLFVLVVLACERVWRRGRVADYAAAGALAGAALAFHYYAVFAAVPLAAAHALRSRGVRAFFASGRVWLAGGLLAASFACLSPYVLLDYRVALRDITANRGAVIGRGLATYGPFGAGIEHVRLMATQGAGFLMLGAAVAGAVVLARRNLRAAVWVGSFPLAYFLFIANAWPFGRLENPLYPFIAVAAAAGIDRIAAGLRAARTATLLLTAGCVIQPALLAVRMDTLMTATDTRTLAARWIETHVAPGSGVAVQPYSVQLTPTRASLEEALRAHVGSVDRASRRFRAQLALDRYPRPAYRVVYLGKGLDQDKRYIDVAGRGPDDLVATLGQACVSVVVLKRFAPGERDPLGEALGRTGERAWSISPFAGAPLDGAATAQMPDYDVRPSRATLRPGPIIDIWRLASVPEPCSTR
jgi:hypothetical protein